jgi:hypothetical protein
MLPKNIRMSLSITARDLLGRSLDRRKTNKVNFEIPKLATSTFWKLAPSLENSVKKQHVFVLDFPSGPLNLEVCTF